MKNKRNKALSYYPYSRLDRIDLQIPSCPGISIGNPITESPSYFHVIFVETHICVSYAPMPPMPPCISLPSNH